MVYLPESILIISQAGVVSEWANDSQRFLLENFDIIQDSPCHIYHSALPLSPSSSWLYKCYVAEASPMVKVVKGVPVTWGECFRTTLVRDSAESLSHHNTNIATGLGHDIIILNTITGSQSAVLSGHTDFIKCAIFSSDGTSLVSGSQDATVKFWDVQTGGAVKTFLGHTSIVWSVSISADLTVIASGSHDKTIRLWNIQIGECYHTIQQQWPVSYVMFSPKDPQHLISVSGNEVWQWDANGHEIRPSFDGNHVAFSSDGAQFVSCNGKNITIYNSGSGMIVTEFQVANYANHCSFSPDSRLVAVAAWETVYCWDITTSEPQIVEIFNGHTDTINSLVFSSPTTLVSASEDDLVKFWQIGAQLADPPIRSVTLESKERVAITSDSEGIIKVWDMSTGICKVSFQTPAKDSRERDLQLVNGRMIFVWCTGGKIHMWDVENGELLWEVDVPWHFVHDLRISGDGLRVFGLYAPSIWAWSLQTGEVVERIEIEYNGSFGSLIVDGSRVWAHWDISNYQGWEFDTPGSTPVELFNGPTLSSSNRFWDP